MKIMVGLILMAATAAPVAAGDQSLQQVLKSGELRIATEPGYQPWIWQKGREGEWTGFEYDFIAFITDHISKQAGGVPLKPTIRNGTWDSLPNDVVQGKADLLLNAYFLPGKNEVKAGQAWSQCYYNTGLRIMYHKNLGREPTVQDLKGSGKVGIFTDQHAIDTLTALGVKFKQDDKDNLFDQYIAKKRFDFIVYDAPAAQWKVTNGKFKGEVLASKAFVSGSEGCYAIMVKQDSKSLLDAINKALDDLAKVRPGMLAKYGL